jgi:N-acyl-D-amino-acid deacylase
MMEKWMLRIFRCLIRVSAAIAVGLSGPWCWAQGSPKGNSMPPTYDFVIRHGTIYDGSGQAPLVGDVAIQGDTISAVGQLSDARGRVEIDAKGMAVAPGFINMLSWATETLLADGRSQSDIRQGVTLEVFGEGESMGPLNEAMKKDMLERQGDFRFDVAWTTLGEYLECLVQRGVSPNVASFVGAMTVRAHEIGVYTAAATGLDASMPPWVQENGYAAWAARLA